MKIPYLDLNFIHQPISNKIIDAIQFADKSEKKNVRKADLELEEAAA